MYSSRYFSDYYKIWIFLTYFKKDSNINILWKSVQWELISPDRLSDEQTWRSKWVLFKSIWLRQKILIFAQTISTSFTWFSRCTPITPPHTIDQQWTLTVFSVQSELKLYTWKSDSVGRGNYFVLQETASGGWQERSGPSWGEVVRGLHGLFQDKINKNFTIKLSRVFRLPVTYR
jgi:hypothetical protein